MLKKIVVFAAIFGFLFSSSLSFAEEKQGIFKKLIDLKNKAFAKKDAAPAVKAEAKPAGGTAPAPAAVPKVAPPAKKTYTKEEMIAHIKETLDHEEEILNFIPGLKKATTEKGESLYTFEGAKLEELNNEKFDKLFSRVNQEATRIRTDRLNRQLETIRRAQQITSAAGGPARVPAPPPQPPRVYSAPNIPHTPPSVPQPPRVPAPPPAPRR